MGRFYTTAQPEFVQDIMYRPPWELAKEVLTKEQSDYDIALAKANVLGNVDIQHMDTDIERENAARISQTYQQKADEIVEQLQKGSAEDWRQTLPSITKVARELEADYKTGDISKIESSAAQYALMNKQLESIKDAATKQRAKEIYLNRFNQQARGSLDKVFSADQVYDKKDLTGEFLSELSKMDTPDSNEVLKHYKANGYINTAKMSTKELTGLKKSFENFVKAKGYQPYLQQQQEFGLGRYFDEQGNLMSVDDARSSLKSGADYVQAAEYKQKGIDESSKVDVIAQEARSHAWEEYQGRQAAKQALLSTPTRQAIVTTDEQVAKLNERYQAGIDALGNRLRVKSSRADGKIVPMDIERTIKTLRNKPGLSPLAKAQLDKDLQTLNEVRQQFVGNKARAGYSVMANVYGPEVASAAQESFNKYAEDPRSLASLKGDIFVKGKLYANTSITDIRNNPTKYGFTKEEAAKVKGDLETEGQDPKDMYVQGSAMPVIVGERPEDWDYNEIKNEWYLGGVPISQQVNFKKLGLEYSSGPKQYTGK